MASIINEIQERLDSVPARLDNAVQRLQPRLLAQLLSLMNELIYDSDSLKRSVANAEQVDRIIAQFQQQVLRGEYGRELRIFASQFDKQAQLIGEFFASEFSHTVSRQSASFMAVNKRNAISALAGDDFKTNFFGRISQTLLDGVESGMQREALIINIKKGLFGTSETEPIMATWVKQVAYDSFAVADRQYTEAVAQEIGVEFYRYTGGLIEDSRCFCEKRNGQFFHRQEIRAWGDGRPSEGVPGGSELLAARCNRNGTFAIVC
jgi:hypothetical protein